MKTIAIIINMIIISLVLTVTGLSQGNEDQISVPFSKPGEPGFVHIDNLGGNLNIEGYEGKEVIIRVDVKDSGLPPLDDLPAITDHSGTQDNDQEISKEGLKKIKSSSFEIIITEDENRISIKSGPPGKTKNLEIKVPNNCSLKVNTINGNISVTSVNGEMEINTINGRIVLDKISGSVVASTINGTIKVKFDAVAPDAPMAFSTINKYIDVTLPADIKATFKMKTDRGDIYTDFDMDIDIKREKSEKEHKYGNGPSITWAEWTTGKINGGGAELVFKSLNGDIHIRKGK